MNNFSYHNPTRLEFGKGTIAKLPKLISKDQKILLLYGGGSIKSNGVWEQVHQALKGYQIQAFGGIEANPDFDTCTKAIDMSRTSGCTYILAVGGGSVLDGAKFIAAAHHSMDQGTVSTLEESWELITGTKKITGALPIGAILTLPATGSEMNANSVISRRATKEKRAFASRFVYPQFSILDPETTFSLPERQTANGIVDAFVHVAEQYLTRDINTPLQDRIAEGILKTLISEGPKVLSNPRDYESRANIMWSCTMALNGLIGVGTIQDWASHTIGHELTAFFGIDHGRTLAIVLPGVLEHEKTKKWPKLLMYAKNVWNLHQGDDQVLIDEAIAKTVLFFESLGVGTRLRDYPGTENAPNLVGDRLSTLGWKMGEEETLDGQAAKEILLTRV
jgi:NADP-dependent alcohol dehydrogenase